VRDPEVVACAAVNADSDANHTRIVAPLTRDRQWPLRTVRGQRCVTLGELPVDLASYYLLRLHRL
jgi:hypothetical protein